MNKSIIDFCKDYNKKCPSRAAYSLILRLREVYIVDCLINKKLWSMREFVSLVKEIASSLNAYQIYLNVKNNEKSGDNLNIEEAYKIYKYSFKKIEEQKKWAEKRK